MTSQTERLKAKFSKLVDVHLDDIVNGLVRKAIEGNYNAAQLLLRLGGLEAETGARPPAEEDQQQARIFFLEMVEQMLGQRPDDAGSKVGRTAGS